MSAATTWKHTFTDYNNLENINASGHQHLEIFQPLSCHRLRLLFNNLYDEIPLRISQMKIYTDSTHKSSVTLRGKSDFEISPRLSEWSDWIDIELPKDCFLSIDIESPNKTIHSVGLTISNSLVVTHNTHLDEPKYFFGVSAIQVQTDKEYERLAFFGDSLTAQGNFSAPLSKILESRFHVMTANYGISGNRLLHPGNGTSKWSTSFGEAGFTRFDHMLVDYQPNTVIFMEGINDLLHPGIGTPMIELPTAKAVTTAIGDLRSKCKHLGIHFVPMTITPAAGSINDEIPGWSDGKETLRLEINEQLRQLPHVIDLADLVEKDGHLKNIFDCGDHVHFSAEGGLLVAEFIQEQLIRKRMI